MVYRVPYGFIGFLMVYRVPGGFIGFLMGL